MSSAAIYLHPNGFDTSTSRLLGRHSAGESFLRGLIRHGTGDKLHFWNVAGHDQQELANLVERIEPPRRPVRWISQRAHRDLSDPGVLHIPTPALPTEAWRRLTIGPTRYAISGITHTTASANVMGILPNLLLSPLEDFDALICTSTAVRGAVETQIGMMRDYMRELYGERRRPELQRVTIPLGVNCADFSITDADRAAWRARLDIPDDAVVALYVGRFNVKAKMNPALMAMALERAARRLGRPIYWVNSGWAETEGALKVYHAETRKLCPSIEYREVDGRAPDTRFSIWSVADFFISFSDNIQESFGLTPVEAMAAGLPSVVSDWDGYRDTVRDGLDGFSIPTLAPRPGLGTDLAHWYENGWVTYDNYIGATGQYVAVDLAAAEAAIVALASNPDLRRQMGEEARRQALRIFDWAAVIPQYEALWAEQDARRRAAATAPPRTNPFAPDPFSLFEAYPTRKLNIADVVSLAEGMTSGAAADLLGSPLAAYSAFSRPSPDEQARLIDQLAANGPMTVAAIRDLFEPVRKPFVERGLLWFARYGVVAITPGA